MNFDIFLIFFRLTVFDRFAGFYTSFFKMFFCAGFRDKKRGLFAPALDNARIIIYII